MELESRSAVFRKPTMHKASPSLKLKQKRPEAAEVSPEREANSRDGSNNGRVRQSSFSFRKKVTVSDENSHFVKPRDSTSNGRDTIVEEPRLDIDRGSSNEAKGRSSSASAFLKPTS